ncbi:hypothetical protein BC826DRAFT_1100487 [Russula brevipes]|nr:hypothetical protein BC826DRAFT_1100487 [Russula brevipes]
MSRIGHARDFTHHVTTPQNAQAHRLAVLRTLDGRRSRFLSFGALRKAQRTLDRTHFDSDSDAGEESDTSHSTEDQRPSDDSSDENKRERGGGSLRAKEIKKRAAVAARTSKHAPAEITARRPVSRRRTVEVRDPRFSQLSGEFDAAKFRNHYHFLSDMRNGELTALRDNVKRARKLVASSPRHLRPEREAEVERLTLAVKRAESSVNKDKRERVQQEALSAMTKEERNKRQHGKKAFWLKNADKKKLLLKAQYDAMAAQGGKRAVKKAIEKRRKKSSQKETKSRPFSRITESPSISRLSKKRKASGDDNVPVKKHQTSA